MCTRCISYVLYNKTDGILAAPGKYTHHGAQQIASSMRMAWKMQGYYKTAKGERIDVDDVELLVMTYDAFLLLGQQN